MNSSVLTDLSDKAVYHSYQEELAFEKELNILRNDFYYQLIDSDGITLVDFMYSPLDTLSGDAYSARRINKEKTFYLIVDGMGKGVSASLTTMIMTTFVNHIIDKMLSDNSFDLHRLIKESIEFIKPILLEEESLSIDYICCDTYSNEINYAKFAMPPFLLQDNDKNMIKLKSNNRPLSKWQNGFKIDNYNVKNINKFLFYSDGVVENTTIDGNTYNSHIEKDFIDSFTKEEFKSKMLERFSKQEDDLSLIFLHRLDLTSKTLIAKKSFDTSLEHVEEASLWYESLWDGITDDMLVSTKASIVFSELFMNAYEHGNLGIDSKTKHKMLDDDTYLDKLKEYEKLCDKDIVVEVYKLSNSSSNYIVTEIIDDGTGFDTQILSEIFRNSDKFNGRGVFMSRKNSMGIYFNKKGNRVLFLSKI